MSLAEPCVWCDRETTLRDRLNEPSCDRLDCIDGRHHHRDCDCPDCEFQPFELEGSTIHVYLTE